ncbi:hypothetical protein [Lactobacillus taiwanensis]|jgi:hypothetical protein|uniref:hypothetical protein n=1 Tax=Lactobacillus taiwanensis TaxID=508451 RepID=UPI001AEBE19D|nr:hypothetical protein [Lactobacillus taiwanensis]MCR1904178.1 hypothetical protein [Lactobacillus taiwanensis]QTQ40871.1 hypothetical protein H1A07_09335 [Lactobacillus taiwanensis]
MLNEKREETEKTDNGIEVHLIPAAVTPDFDKMGKKITIAPKVKILHEIKLPEEGEWIPLF